MAKIARKTAKIFGFNGPAGPNGVAQFGSFAASAPIFSLDPDVIQALSAWLNGWNAAIVAGDLPALEDMNAMGYVSSYQVAYLLQMGIPEWDASTPYYKNSFAQSSGIIYVSLTDNNTGNPVSDPTNWIVFAGGGSRGENLLRNAGFKVNQRGTSGTVLATPTYTSDGWILNSVGANLAWSIDNTTPYPDPGAGQNLLKLQGATGMTACLIKQRIEGLNTASLPASKRVTLQFFIANGTGSPLTPKLSVFGCNTLNSFGSTFTVLFPTDMATVPAGTNMVVAYTFDLSGFAASNGFEFLVDVGQGGVMGNNSHFVEVTNFDVCYTPNLNTGIQFNPPVSQIADVGIDLVHCQRYLVVMGGNDVNETFGIGFAPTTANGYVQIPFRNQMRVPPVFSYSANADFEVSAASGSKTISLIAIGFNSPDSILMNASLSTAITAGEGCILKAAGTTNARLFFSAEL